MAVTDSRTLRDALIVRAQSDPDVLAYADDAGAVSFAELAERAAGRARALQQEGIGAGDRLALVLSAGVTFAELFWAAQLIGAVPCSFNGAVPRPALERRVEQIDPRLVVTDETAERWAPVAGTLREPALAEDDLALLQLTSGTSGSPRAAMIHHRNMLAFLRACDRDAHLRPDDVLVCWVPPWHDLGLGRFIVGAVYHGLSCHIVPPAIRTIPRWLAKIEEVRGTVSGAPDFAHRLAARMVDPARLDITSLRLSTTGAEPVRWSSIEEFEQAFRVPGAVTPAYGIAEATLGVTTHLPGERRNVDERGNVSNGRPLSGIEVVAGASWDAPEEIRVRGEVVFSGYFNAPQETARTLRDGWLHTGDSGYLDEEGRLYILGRRSGMLKRAGSLVAPRELEEAAQRVREVRVAAATMVRAQPAERDAIVVLLEADGRAEVSEEAIAAEASRQIVSAVGFSPSKVSVVPRGTIPRTENGKVQHDRLRQVLAGLPLASSASAAAS